MIMENGGNVKTPSLGWFHDSAILLQSVGAAHVVTARWLGKDVERGRHIVFRDIISLFSWINQKKKKKNRKPRYLAKYIFIQHDTKEL
jgi:hypothetical protein